MNKGPISIVAPGLIAAVFCVSAVHATQTLPFGDSFESFSVGAPYTTDGTGIVQSQSVTTLAGAGSKSLLVSNDTVNLAILDGAYSNVWIQIYAKPVTGTTDPASVTGANASGAFYVRDTGTIRVYNGSVWADGGSVTPGNWVGFLAHVDHALQKWDLYTVAGAFLSVGTKVASNLDMSGTYDDLEQFSIQSGEAGYVDGLGVAEGGEDVSVASPNRVAVAKFSGSANAREFVLPAYAAAWTNTPGNRSLAGLLGEALKSGLLPLEQIRIGGTNSWTWDQYYVTGPGQWAVHGDTLGATGPATAYIYENTRLLCVLNAGRDPATTFGFFPYDSTSYSFVNGVSGPGAPPTTTLQLNGKNQNSGAWTAISWNDSVAIGDLPWGVDELDNGDRLFVAFPSNLNQFKEYWWQEGVGRWMDFASQTSVIIPAGSKFWLRRGATSPVQVTYTR